MSGRNAPRDFFNSYPTYRATLRGKEKRKAQSRRYRERVRDRKEPSAGEAARVISLKFS